MPSVPGQQAQGDISGSNGRGRDVEGLAFGVSKGAKRGGQESSDMDRWGEEEGAGLGAAGVRGHGEVISRQEVVEGTADDELEPGLDWVLENEGVKEIEEEHKVEDVSNRGIEEELGEEGSQKQEEEEEGEEEGEEEVEEEEEEEEGKAIELAHALAEGLAAEVTAKRGRLAHLMDTPTGETG
jgi:hypothetical protein